MGKWIEMLELAHLAMTDPDLVGLTRDDIEFCAYLGTLRETPEDNTISLGRLDWSPKKNWVENEGGLPKYIEDIALALIRDHGMDRSRAIATAISRVRRWANGGEDVKADTRAKAKAAIEQWEKMKASTKSKRASK